MDLKSLIPKLKEGVSKTEAFVKSVGAVVIGGGLNSAVELFRTGEHDLAKLKASFISGAGIALAYLYLHSPFAQKIKQQPQ